MIDMLENNFVLFQVNQEQLMEYLRLEFSLKQRPKDEQQPLPDDLVKIDTSIKNLEQQAKDLKHSITFGLAGVARGSQHWGVVPDFCNESKIFF